jgi:saccharopine dehydrogenase-like NADP-dependent oxidoreductase
MIARSEKEGKDKTRRSSGTTTSLNKANNRAMASGSGTQAVVVAGAMMEEGLGTRSDALPSHGVKPT